MDARVLAAAYLRVSTGQQQFSLANQGQRHRTVRPGTWFRHRPDLCGPREERPALKHRPGLRQLIEDVVKGSHTYRAILVYDVSRWGRFQDSDEAAHYEFVCKSAGVPVRYCAKTFTNDNTLPFTTTKMLPQSHGSLTEGLCFTLKSSPGLITPCGRL